MRRNPADGDAHFVLAAALVGRGQRSRGDARAGAGAALSSDLRAWEKRPAADAVPKGLERIKSDVELPHARAIDEQLAATEQRDQQELARFYLDRGRRLFRAGERSRGASPS